MVEDGDTFTVIEEPDPLKTVPSDNVPLMVPLPVTDNVNEALLPAQIVVLPLIAPVGRAFTVTDFCAELVHPLVITVYIIFAEPAPTAVTRPEPLTVATEILSLLHVPPASPLLLNDAVEPMHGGEVPLTVPAFGLLFTVITIGPNVDVQLFELVTSTVTDAPLASAVVL